MAKTHPDDIKTLCPLRRLRGWTIRQKIEAFRGDSGERREVSPPPDPYAAYKLLQRGLIQSNMSHTCQATGTPAMRASYRSRLL